MEGINIPDLTTHLIVIGATAVVVVAILLISRRAKKGRLAALQALAQQHGWRFEELSGRLSSGYRIDGGAWSLESVKVFKGPDPEPHLSNLAQSTVWRAGQTLPAGRNLLIGPAVPNAALGQVGEMLKQKVLQRYLGESAEGLQEVQAGSSTFLQHFMILANDPDDVKRLFSLDAEMALMRWKDSKPVVLITGQGIEIRMENRHLEKEEDVLSVVRLGESFLKVRGW